MFKLLFTPTAQKQFLSLQKSPSKKEVFKAVCKTLGFLETNLKHPSLKTHEFTSLKGPHGEKVFEAYAQNKTPGAFRVFWYYGPDKNKLTIAAITPHP
jgi:hypothetical protein